MNIKDVKELIEIVNNSNLAYFEYTIDGAHIKMDKSLNRSEGESTNRNHQINKYDQVELVEKSHKEVTLDSTVSEEKVEKVKGIEIKSPMVGTFYNSPSPDKPSFIEVGKMVKKGDILCIIEAMKLMNEIESDVQGEILEILVNNGDMVEYGQPILLVKEV